MRKTEQSKAGYACEPLAGCVYHYEGVSVRKARTLSALHEQPHMIELIATVSPGRAEHRMYYSLDLPQAIAKAAELVTRMRQQRVGVRLCAVRPATDDETEVFFAELAKYDGNSPAGNVERGRL